MGHPYRIGWIRGFVSGAIERWNAETRGDGAELDRRPGHFTDGRAVQRARRAHALADGRGTADAVVVVSVCSFVRVVIRVVENHSLRHSRSGRSAGVVGRSSGAIRGPG